MVPDSRAQCLEKLIPTTVADECQARRRSNFERTSGSSAPLLQSPLAHFHDICAGILSGFPGYPAVPPRCTRHHHAEEPEPMIATRKVRVRSGSSRAPSPMEKAFPRREHNFVREETDDDDDKHDADNLIHRI